MFEISWSSVTASQSKRDIKIKMAAPTKEMVTVEQVKLLVENLESQRCLWEFKHPAHHDRNMKSMAWDFLITNTGLSKDSVKRSYETLRYQFRKVRGSSCLVSCGITDIMSNYLMMITRFIVISDNHDKSSACFP